MSSDSNKNHKLQIRCNEATAKKFHMVRTQLMFSNPNGDVVDHEYTLLALINEFEKQQALHAGKMPIGKIK